MAFLQAVIASYVALGVKVTQLITDNGAACRARAFKLTCQALGVKHTFIQPERPQTNGRAERFIQTCLRQSACARVWVSSEARKACLPR